MRKTKLREREREENVELGWDRKTLNPQIERERVKKREESGKRRLCVCVNVHVAFKNLRVTLTIFF